LQAEDYIQEVLN
jgi:hypothetical protein